MSYQVPQHIDNNKVFIINRSEIKGRLDPKMALYNRRVQNWSYPKVRLKDLLLCKPQYGAAESGITRTDIKSPRYIRITDIDEYGLISHNDLGATANTIEDQYILHDFDLLIARSGATVGKAYIHKECPYTCFFAGYLIRFVINTNKALPDYVFAFTQTNTYKEWVNAIQRPSGQPNINAEEYQSLEIPLPPPNIQNEIVSIIQTAYSEKKRKEFEAQQLLDSIDTYLLNELGITLPVFQNDLNKRIFTSSYHQIIGKRIDPLYTLCWGKSAISNIYKSISLRVIADIYKGDALTSDNVVPGTIPVIAGGQTSPYSHNEANYQGNVITVSASGAYAGYVWYHRSPIYATDCCVICSKDENNFLTEYIFEVLKVQQENIYWLQTGAAQPHVYASDLESLAIPVIPLSLQQIIVERIRETRLQAKTLQEEGKRILELAKQEVEQKIIYNS